MIAGKNQHIIGIIAFHVVDILVNSICRTGIPLAVLTLFIRGQNGNAADIAVKVPGNTNSNMRIKPKWLILCQNTHRIYSRIDAVAKREINDSVFAAKRHCWFCNLGCQHTQSASLATCQKHRNHFFLIHSVTPYSSLDSGFFQSYLAEVCCHYSIVSFKSEFFLQFISLILPFLCVIFTIFFIFVCFFCIFYTFISFLFVSSLSKFYNSVIFLILTGNI